MYIFFIGATMYQFITCIVKRKMTWASIEIKDKTLAELLASYSEVVITLDHPFFKEPEQLRLRDIKTKVWHYSGNIIQYLESIGDASLPTQPKFIDLDKRTSVEYISLPAGGYTTTFTNRNYHPDTEIKRGACSDILVSRPDTNYERLGKSCVFTIGGYIQVPTIREDGILLPNALHLMDRLEKDSFGMFNLGVLGELVYLPITEENIKMSTPVVNTFANSIFLEHKYTDYKDYHLFLVIGGLLQPLDTITVVGDHLLKVNLEDWPIVANYVHTKRVHDYEGIKEVITEDTNEVVAKLMSNDGMAKWFEDESTFIIGVTKVKDRPICLETKRHPHSTFRGCYITSKPPTGLLRNNKNEIMDYVCIPRDGSFEVLTKEDFVPNYIIGDNAQWNQSKVITSMKDRRKPYSYSDATEELYYYLT